MKFKVITVFLSTLLTVLSSCTTSYYFNGYGGNREMKINKNGTYEFYWERLYMGAIYDTVDQKGTYYRNGDTLILTSEKLPLNQSLITVTESRIKNFDSISIKIYSDDTIPLFFFAPTSIVLNNTHFPLERGKEAFITTIPKQKVEYLILTRNTWDFPIYLVQDSLANLFDIKITEITNKEDQFHPGSYFYRQRFLQRGDSLYFLHNDRTGSYLIKQ